jgi:hypothetical protein
MNKHSWDKQGFIMDKYQDYKKIVKTAYPYLNFLFLSFAKKFCEYH